MLGMIPPCIKASGFEPRAEGLTRIPATFQFAGFLNSASFGKLILSLPTLTVFASSISFANNSAGKIFPSADSSLSEISASTSAFVCGTGHRNETSLTSSGVEEGDAAGTRVGEGDTEGALVGEGDSEAIGDGDGWRDGAVGDGEAAGPEGVDGERC